MACAAVIRSTWNVLSSDLAWLAPCHPAFPVRHATTQEVYLATSPSWIFSVHFPASVSVYVHHHEGNDGAMTSTSLRHSTRKLVSNEKLGLLADALCWDFSLMRLVLVLDLSAFIKRCPCYS